MCLGDRSRDQREVQDGGPQLETSRVCRGLVPPWDGKEATVGVTLHHGAHSCFSKISHLCVNARCSGGSCPTQGHYLWLWIMNSLPCKELSLNSLIVNIDLCHFSSDSNYSQQQIINYISKWISFIIFTCIFPFFLMKKKLVLVSDTTNYGFQNFFFCFYLYSYVTFAVRKKMSSLWSIG